MASVSPDGQIPRRCDARLGQLAERPRHPGGPLAEDEVAPGDLELLPLLEEPEPVGRHPRPGTANSRNAARSRSRADRGRAPGGGPERVEELGPRDQRLREPLRPREEGEQPAEERGRRGQPREVGRPRARRWRRSARARRAPRPDRAPVRSAPAWRAGACAARSGRPPGRRPAPALPRAAGGSGARARDRRSRRRRRPPRPRAAPPGTVPSRTRRRTPRTRRGPSGASGRSRRKNARAAASRSPCSRGAARASRARPDRPAACGSGARGGAEAVLDRPEEDVGVREPPRLLPGEVAALGEPVERAQAVPLAEPGILAAVEELEGLDVELDVADPPDTELDVALLLPARAEAPVDPVLHRPDLAERLALEPGAVDDLARQVEERLPDPLVPGGHARLDERLALPEGPARLHGRRGRRRAGAPAVRRRPRAGAGGRPGRRCPPPSWRSSRRPAARPGARSTRGSTRPRVRPSRPRPRRRSRGRCRTSS